MFNFVNVKRQVLSLPLSSLSVTHGVSHHYHNGTTALFFVFTPCWTVDLRFHYHILSHLYHQVLLGLPAHFCGQVIGPAVSWLWPPALSQPATTPLLIETQVEELFLPSALSLPTTTSSITRNMSGGIILAAHKCLCLPQLPLLLEMQAEGSFLPPALSLPAVTLSII